MDVNDFDQALDGAVHAINSMTYTHGRPPYMAVFGQIPRVASGLLQDDMSLITHPVQQGRIRPDILRAEAMRALADINTSQALRRALLRKTATTNQKDLLPGQSCAYWRRQIPKGRGTKKKGAWIVARFLSYDPDGPSAWLHSGTTTIQVSLEQLRGAFGFEHWQPTRGGGFGFHLFCSDPVPDKFAVSNSLGSFRGLSRGVYLASTFPVFTPRPMFIPQQAWSSQRLLYSVVQVSQLPSLDHHRFGASLDPTCKGVIRHTFQFGKQDFFQIFDWYVCFSLL